MYKALMDFSTSSASFHAGDVIQSGQLTQDQVETLLVNGLIEKIAQAEPEKTETKPAGKRLHKEK